MSVETTTTCDICGTERSSDREGWAVLHLKGKDRDVGPRCLLRLNDTGGRGPRPGETMFAGGVGGHLRVR